MKMGACPSLHLPSMRTPSRRDKTYELPASIQTTCMNRMVLVENTENEKKISAYEHKL